MEHDTVSIAQSKQPWATLGWAKGCTAVKKLNWNLRSQINHSTFLQTFCVITVAHYQHSSNPKLWKASHCFFSSTFGCLMCVDSLLLCALHRAKYNMILSSQDTCIILPSTNGSTSYNWSSCFNLLLLTMRQYRIIHNVHVTYDVRTNYPYTRLLVIHRHQPSKEATQKM